MKTTRFKILLLIGFFLIVKCSSFASDSEDDGSDYDGSLKEESYEEGEESGENDINEQRDGEGDGC
jgi:hypothetical protein